MDRAGIRHSARTAKLAGLLCAIGSTVFGQAIWTGPPGGGMLSVQEPTVSELGRGATGIILDNYDRDPLGLDIDELRQSLRIRLGHRWELYGSYYFSRAVTIPGAHPAPTSPMDIVVATGQAPVLPNRAIYWPLPYTGKRSSGVGDMIPGDIQVGLKRQLIGQHGRVPSVSLSANIIVPASRSLRNLHRGSGSGSIDTAVHAAVGWTLGRWTLAANLGYMKSGSLPYDDRIITPDGTVDLALARPDFIRTAAGVRVRLNHRASLMAEAFHLGAVGGRTSTLDSVGATDVLAGFQLDLWHLTFTAGIRQHLWPPPNEMTRQTSSLAGAVALTGVPIGPRSAYLTAIGVPIAGLRPTSSLVVTGAPTDVPLPEGAYRLPDTYKTSTTGNAGAVLLVGFRF
jgi:hypothetical protein